MYTSTFIFAAGNFDAHFHRLDQEIAEMARAIPGYLGEEVWQHPSNGQVCNVYHWSSLEALQQLVQHPSHQEAKRLQANWLQGYRVVISQVLRTYGDARLGPPVTPAPHADPAALPADTPLSRA